MKTFWDHTQPRRIDAIRLLNIHLTCSCQPREFHASRFVFGYAWWKLMKCEGRVVSIVYIQSRHHGLMTADCVTFHVVIFRTVVDRQMV